MGMETRTKGGAKRFGLDLRKHGLNWNETAIGHSASGRLALSRSVLDLSRWFHFIAQKKTRQWA
ncbi:hypothetical protein L3Q82_026749, partial [Scortum barcoo]